MAASPVVAVPTGSVMNHSFVLSRPVFVNVISHVVHPFFASITMFIWIGANTANADSTVGLTPL